MGLAMRERHIVAIDTPEKLSAQYQAHEILDLPNHLLMRADQCSGYALGIVGRGGAMPHDVYGGGPDEDGKMPAGR